MIKTIIFITFLTIFCCATKTEKQQNEITKIIEFKSQNYHFSGTLDIVEIDSCEYVFVFIGNASWGSHKGNCKFCKARNSQNK